MTMAMHEQIIELLSYYKNKHYYINGNEDDVIVIDYVLYTSDKDRFSVFCKNRATLLIPFIGTGKFIQSLHKQIDPEFKIREQERISRIPMIHSRTKRQRI